MRKCFICGDVEENTRIYSSKWSNKEDVCNKHLLHLKRHGRALDDFPSRRNDKRVCDVCGDNKSVTIYTNADSEYRGMLFCTKHKSQVQLYGKILKITKFDKNEIVEYKDYAEVIMRNEKIEEVARALIDLKDIDLISEYKWTYGSYDYAVTHTKDGRYLAMHQLIMDTKDTSNLVDHIDRKKLNNRRSNLRIANKSINAINVGLRSHNKSGVTGVSFSNDAKKWRSYINYEGKRIELGYFREIDDAIRTRLSAELNYYPNYPPQRHLFEEYGIGENIYV